MPGGGDALDVLRAPEQSGTGSMISDVAENAEWMAKRLVWIPSDKNGYEAASIKEDLDDDKWVLTLSVFNVLTYNEIILLLRNFKNSLICWGDLLFSSFCINLAWFLPKWYEPYNSEIFVRYRITKW